ncbi:MAG: hypothetical protein ACUVV4_08905 [Candidatus Bathyarchaeia archaeon]
MRTKGEEEKTHYYTEKEPVEIAESFKLAVTLPVDVEIKADHRVLDLNGVEKILRDSKLIFLNDCGCRTLHRNCGNPLDTCIAVNVKPDYAEKNKEYNPRRVTVEEALASLRKSHEAGLVHMAYIMKSDDKPLLTCSCYTCCCHTVGGLRHGIHTKVLSSKLIADDDDSKCINCGECVKRCVLGARKMQDGVKKYEQIKCFGFGLCVSTYPSNVIMLVKRLHKRLSIIN